MKVINFEKLQLLDVKVCKTIKIKLELDKELDLPYSVFFSNLKEKMTKELDIILGKTINVPVIFAIHTDLNQEDLGYARDNILSVLTDVLINGEKRVQRHEEKRLGTMGFDSADINLFQFMELVNYKTKIDEFDVHFYDKSNRLFEPLISRKA